MTSAKSRKKTSGPDRLKPSPQAQPESRIIWLILVCFFLSGMTALTYEIIWMRHVSRVIGGAPFAISTILVVFMAGMGIGSYLAGRLADRIPPHRLIGAYGFLELLIGVYALFVPILLWLLRHVYALFYDRLLDYTIFYNLLIFAGAMLVLSVPAICMGATLPILSRFYVGSLSKVGTHSSRLYGLNTIGAAAGSLLCGFWLIAHLGVWGAMFLAVVVNIGIGLICIAVSHKQKPQTAQAPPDPPKPSEISFPPPTAQANGTLVIFAVSGFCAMAYQVLWTKLLGLIIGPTTYSFTIVVVTFIVGLAIGNLVFGVLADRVRNVFRLLLITQVIAAITALLASQVMGISQLFFARLLFTFADSFALQNLVKALTLFGFMLIPTFFLGAAFPLAVKIYTRSMEHVGRSIGVAYASNTVGAVAGSFLAGFVFIPLLGKENAVSLAAAIQMAVPLIVGIMVWQASGHKLVPRLVMTVALIACMALSLTLPSWNRLALATGKYHRFEEMRVIEEITNGAGWIGSLFRGAAILAGLETGKLVYYGDGIGGFTTVLKYPGPFGDAEYSMANSGKMDASTRGDMKTQTLLAHFPMLFSKDAKTVMVLGLASGVTAGEVLHYPVERVDVIDINDRVFEAARFFEPWNNGVLDSPRTRLIMQDGMAHLTLTKSRYDVIISEPSNPWMAGMASLFTHDFFTLARNRLTDDGIYVQWFHCYQMDWDTFALVGRTFAEVFPHSILVTAEPAGLGRDYLFVGFKKDRGIDLAKAGQNLAYAQQSDHIRLAYPELMYRLIVAEDLKTLFGPGRLNHDDRPYLEYAAPKLMYGGQAAQQEILRRLIAGRTVTESTASGFSRMTSDPKALLDFADYALSVYSPFVGMVDEASLGAADRARYRDMIHAYCEGNIIEPGVLTDPGLVQSCRAIQIATMEKNLSKAVDPSLTHYFLGRLYEEEGKADRALSHFARSVTLHGKDPDRYNDYGNLLAARGRYAEAREQFSQALALRPNYLLALGNMAYAYLNEGRLDEARQYFMRIVSLHSDIPEAHYSLGRIASLKKDDRQAVNHLRDALRLAPDMPEALHELASILVFSNNPLFADPVAAARLAARASALTNDTEPLYLETLAAALKATGDLQGASRAEALARKAKRGGA